MNRPIIATIFAGVATLQGAAAARAQGPPPATQPGTTELIQEIRLLRQQMQQQQRHHDQEIDTLRKQIEELRRQAGGHAAAAGPGFAAGVPTSGPSAEDELEAAVVKTGGTTLGGAPKPGQGPLSLQGALQSFNPDISLNGDFVAAYTSSEGGQIDDEMLFRELEIGFSGAVDPYTKATAIVTVGRQDNEFKADLEEAYLSFLGLPYDLQARVGQFRAEFGKTNPVHLHALPWTDYPLVIKRYFGDEGLSGAGAEISWLVPNPARKYLLVTYEVINNDNSSLFAGEESDDFAHIVHFKSFFDLSRTSTLELGASFAEAPNDAGHGSHRSMVEGLDLTYRWKPRDAGLYRSFLWQSEVLFAQADLIGGQESTWGMYSAAEYQFARRWKIGARYDNTQLPFSSTLHERGYSTYLTFLQSEFVFWRLGWLFTDRNFQQDGNDDEQQLFLQLNWTLGAHPAHRY